MRLCVASPALYLCCECLVEEQHRAEDDDHTLHHIAHSMGHGGHALQGVEGKLQKATGACLLLNIL